MTTGRPAVELTQVTKRFRGGVTAVDHLDLRIDEGEVVGFLGSNGAGKTTTMRMLVGLVRPTSGTVRVLGAAPGAPGALARVGALIESPTFYPHLSGLDNLRLVGRYAGIPDAAAHRVLSEVGLTERAGSPFRAYSLGMKQRLGIAAALLKGPDLLILDEPTNGLDPAGVAEIRELIRSLGARGHTVLLSSHVLGEVEQVCDRVALLDRGRLIADGSPEHLRADLGGGTLLIDAEPATGAATFLREHVAVRAVELVDGQLRVTADPALAATLNRHLVQAGFEVRELRPVRHSLEEAFLRLTTAAPEEQKEPAAAGGGQ
ncbi:ABC transporter ATP-binding protein [Micromonospora sp. NPDC005220]|uniref:ABC transporter ATP-binding protein n=1 Tax=Micromonospora sp. NPDC005220 TaxID=3155589 RepID=UPI0033AC9524